MSESDPGGNSTNGASHNAADNASHNADEAMAGAAIAADGEKHRSGFEQTSELLEEGPPPHKLQPEKIGWPTWVGGRAEWILSLAAAGIIVAVLGPHISYASTNWLPALTGGLRDFAMAKLVPKAQKPSIRLGFEQNPDEPSHGTFDSIDYRLLKFLSPLAQTNPAHCPVLEALGRLAGDKDIAQDHYESIIKDPACSEASVGHAYFEIGNISVSRATRQNSNAMFKLANKSYDDAFAKLEGKTEERMFLYAITINQSIIILKHPDARLSPNDLAKAFRRIDKVATDLIRPSGADQEEIGRTAVLLRQKLAEAKADEDRTKPKDEIVIHNKPMRPRQPVVNYDVRPQYPDPSFSWPCKYARTADGKFHKAEKCSD